MCFCARYSRSKARRAASSRAEVASGGGTAAGGGVTDLIAAGFAVIFCSVFGGIAFDSGLREVESWLPKWFV